MSLLFAKPKDNTTRKGEITESAILARLIQVGHQCLIPWGHDHRYDIAIDDDGKLVRIQCKTARYIEKSGCLQFNTALLMLELEASHISGRDIKGKQIILECIHLIQGKFT